jgi:prepilin-type N-terminal cleavage/methylation domain-containing protein/prepilin-type processing-associated H-X9-DG protein
MDWEVVSCHRRGDRRGFTILELVVVLLIIGILASVLLPAIQYAREAARRTQCQNNLRQQAFACQNFEAAHRSLPAFYDRPTKNNNNAAVASGCINGDYDIGGYSWRVKLLPFLEQRALHEKFDLSALPWEPVNEHLVSTVVPTFLCPTNPLPTWDDLLLREGGPTYPGDRLDMNPIAISEYEARLGIFVADDPHVGDIWGDPPNMEKRKAAIKYIRWGVWGEADIDLLHNWYAFSEQAIGIAVRGYQPGRFASVTDGLSNTILLVEEGAKPLWIDPRTQGGRYHHFPSWQTATQIAASFHRFKNTINYSNDRGIYSLHSGGANIAMADGSVVFLSQELEYRELVRLYTRAGAIDE